MSQNKHKLLAFTLVIALLFGGCAASDFLIVGSTLESYNGEGGDIIIPEKVSSINSDVFQGKDNIISIDVSDNVYAIDAQSFKNCNSLSSITLPVKIIRIGDESFDGCDKLTDIYYDGAEVDWGKIKIGKNVFSSSVTIHFNDGTSKTIKASNKNNVFMNADVNESLTQIGTGYGRRAYIVIDKETAKTASQEDFAEFLEMRVDGKDYNWFTIDFGDGTGIVFPGCLWEIGTYCKLQPEGMQGETIGYLKVVDRENYLVEYITKSSETTLITNTQQATVIKETETLTINQKRAVEKANSYLNFMAFSRTGLIDQLEFDGCSNDDASFAVDHISVDWNEQSAKMAKSYLDTMSLSKSELIKQLEFEGFTSSQAEYGAKAVGY